MPVVFSEAILFGEDGFFLALFSTLPNYWFAPLAEWPAS
jgi:hypothetical protein